MPQISKIKFLKIAANVLLVGVLASVVAQAQTTPEFMITWKAANYAPADFAGRVLPTAGTKIDVAVELIDGGHLADLSARQIRWGVNGGVPKSATGMKTFSFNADQSSDVQIVDVTIPSYKGASLTKRLAIPTIKPEVVIASAGAGLFRVLPYFFNVANLNQMKFTWTAGGKQAESGSNNPDLLAVVPSANRSFSIDLQVLAQSLINEIEVAQFQKTFTQQ